MKQPKVWTFFYGSYINLNVIKEADLIPEQHEVAKLNGFDIQIRPLANLIRSDQHCVYGITTTATHDELRRLYTHAEQVLGGIYLPEAVLVERRDGTWRPALCYIAPSIHPQPAARDYVDRISDRLKSMGFLLGTLRILRAFGHRGETRGHRLNLPCTVLLPAYGLE